MSLFQEVLVVFSNHALDVTIVAIPPRIFRRKVDGILPELKFGSGLVNGSGFLLDAHCKRSFILLANEDAALGGAPKSDHKMCCSAHFGLSQRIWK